MKTISICTLFFLIFSVIIGFTFLSCGDDDDDAADDDDTVDDDTDDDDTAGDDDDDDTAGDDDDSLDDDDTDDDDVDSEVYVDTQTGLIWQKELVGLEAVSFLEFPEAVTYCDNLDYGGHQDWRLPTVSELRTIVRGCSQTEAGGSCAVTDQCPQQDCWDITDCKSCEWMSGPANGFYVVSELADYTTVDYYWSSTLVDANIQPDRSWSLLFATGNISELDTIDESGAMPRCVR